MKSSLHFILAVFTLISINQFRPGASFPLPLVEIERRDLSDGRMCWNLDEPTEPEPRSRPKRNSPTDDLKDEEKVHEAIDILYKKRRCENNQTGIFGHPTDCWRYFACNSQEVTKECDEFEVFDELLSECVHATKVNFSSKCLPDAQKLINGEDIRPRSSVDTTRAMTTTESPIVASSSKTTDAVIVTEAETPEPEARTSTSGPEDVDSNQVLQQQQEGPEAIPHAATTISTSTATSIVTSPSVTTTDEPEIVDSHPGNAEEPSTTEFTLSYVSSTGPPQVQTSSPTFVPGLSEQQTETDEPDAGNESTEPTLAQELDKEEDWQGLTFNGTTTPGSIIVTSASEEQEYQNETSSSPKPRSIDEVENTQLEIASTEPTFFSLFSENTQISIVITILLFVLLIVIFFCCCYLLRGLYQWAAIKKKEKISAGLSAHWSSKSPQSSYKRYPSITSPYAPQEMEETTTEPVELNGIMIDTALGRRTSNVSDGKGTESEKLAQHLSTFEIQSRKSIEISSDKLVHDLNEVTHRQLSCEEHDQQNPHLEKVNRRKKVEIYIPNLNLPNVREPFYVRSIVEEMEDEYLNALESKKKGQEYGILCHQNSLLSDDFYKEAVASEDRNNANNSDSNGRIAHVSPLKKEAESQVGGIGAGKEQENQHKPLSMSTFKSGASQSLDMPNNAKRESIRALKDGGHVLEYYF